MRCRLGILIEQVLQDSRLLVGRHPCPANLAEVNEAGPGLLERSRSLGRQGSLRRGEEERRARRVEELWGRDGSVPKPVLRFPQRGQLDNLEGGLVASLGVS